MKKENADVENHSMFDIDNYFKLFSLKEKFDINKKTLYKNYIRLQQILHPDKFSSKSNVEKNLAIEYTSEVNQGYEVLSDDKKRAEYLLSLKGIIINQEEGNNIHPDPALFHEILDLSEEQDETSIAKMKAGCIEDFKILFNQGDYESAAQAIIKAQFLNRL